MKEQLTSPETSRMAKEKGFDIETTYYYDFTGYVCSDKAKINWNQSKETIYSAPTQSFLQKWLREVHNIYVLVRPIGDEKDYPRWEFEIIRLTNHMSALDNIMQSLTISYEEQIGKSFATFEEALEEGLQAALKLI